MNYIKLPRENLDALAKNLSAYGRVFGPVRVGESHHFREVQGLGEMSLNHVRTMIPPKKFFHMLEERMFTYDERKGSYMETLEEGRIVVFGMHPCDIYALRLMDKIYMDKAPDKYYSARREKAVIIGHSCHPDEYCFCQSLGIHYASSGFDLFLHELKDGYFIRIGSDKGNTIAVENSALFRNVEGVDIEEFRGEEKRREAEFTLRLDINTLQDMLSLAYESDLWKEYAEKCFGCGSCNLVCPTCRCYNVEDNIAIDLRSGERVRKLDSCMLRRHGLVAGGLNFRPTRVEKLRNRFNCKGSLREDMLNCVGCGRCTVYCPSKIDYVEVLRKVRGEI